MKQIIFIFMSLLCFSCSSKAQNQTADTNVQSDKKILFLALASAAASFSSGGFPPASSFGMFLQ